MLTSEKFIIKRGFFFFVLIAGVYFRSLFIMLDSLNSLDGSTSSVGQAWLNQVLQRHDIARVLEPLLLLLLHPKTQRVSVQRVQAERYWSKTSYYPGEENDKHFMQNFTCNNGKGHKVSL